MILRAVSTQVVSSKENPPQEELTSVFLVRGSLSPDLAPAPAYWRPLSEPGMALSQTAVGCLFLSWDKNPLGIREPSQYLHCYLTDALGFSCLDEFWFSVGPYRINPSTQILA